MKTATRTDRLDLRRRTPDVPRGRQRLEGADDFNQTISLEFEREGMGVAPKE